MYRKSRYEKGDGDDYLNIPLDRAQYAQLVADLRTLERHEPKSFEADDGARYFEGCLPIEEMADRGDDVLRFGPLKPVGLARSAHRQDRRTRSCSCAKRTSTGRRYNLVGFQTRLDVAGADARRSESFPGLATRRVAALGRDAPQHVHRLAASAGRTLRLRGSDGL